MNKYTMFYKGCSTKVVVTAPTKAKAWTAANDQFAELMKCKQSELDEKRLTISEIEVGVSAPEE